MKNTIQQPFLRVLLSISLFTFSIAIANAGAGIPLSEAQCVFRTVHKTPVLQLGSEMLRSAPLGRRFSHTNFRTDSAVRHYSTEQTERFLDPKNDVAFKKLFGTEEHKPLLISFLNSLLRLEDGQIIKTVDLLPTEQIPSIKSAQRPLLTVNCTDQGEAQYIVALQNAQYGNFIEIPQFLQHCAAKSYVNQFGSGLGYKALKPVVLLGIANGILFPKKLDYMSYHSTFDTKTHERDLEDLSYAFVELPKFKKTEDELKTLEDMWLYLLKHAPEMNAISKDSPPEIRKAYATLKESNWTQKEKEAYTEVEIALKNEIGTYMYILHGVEVD